MPKEFLKDHGPLKLIYLLTGLEGLIFLDFLFRIPSVWMPPELVISSWNAGNLIEKSCTVWACLLPHSHRDTVSLMSRSTGWTLSYVWLLSGGDVRGTPAQGLARWPQASHPALVFISSSQFVAIKPVFLCLFTYLNDCLYFRLYPSFCLSQNQLHTLSVVTQRNQCGRSPFPQSSEYALRK